MWVQDPPASMGPPSHLPAVVLPESPYLLHLLARAQAGWREVAALHLTGVICFHFFGATTATIKI